MKKYSGIVRLERVIRPDRNTSNDIMRTSRNDDIVDVAYVSRAKLYDICISLRNFTTHDYFMISLEKFLSSIVNIWALN